MNLKCTVSCTTLYQILTYPCIQYIHLNKQKVSKKKTIKPTVETFYQIFKILILIYKLCKKKRMLFSLFCNEVDVFAP